MTVGPSSAPTDQNEKHHHPDPLPYTVVALFGLVIASSADSIHLTVELLCVLFGAALYYVWSGRNSTMTAQRRMTMTAQVPAVIRSHLLPSPDLDTSGGYWPSDDDCDASRNLGILLKRSDDPHEGAVVIYYVHPDSYAAEHTELEAGCEVLVVNKRRVRGCASQAMQLIEKSLKKYGKVNLLCSLGTRPKGSSYVIGKMSITGKGEAPQSIEKDSFSGTGNVIDGLELEEMNGLVKIVANNSTSGSVFSGIHLNGGDRLYAVDGKPIDSIDDVRRALIKAAEESHVMVPMLTYNLFRRLKTAVMCSVASTMMSAVGSVGEGGKAVNKWSARAANINDDYEIGKKLGEGAFAEVKKATHRSTGEVYAIKIITRASLNKDMDEALKEEISILKELGSECEHIYELSDVVVTINHYYLVTEYLDGGELFDRIVDKSSYTESEARDVCAILFGAIEYMHSKGVAHRDLKPENLLLKHRDNDHEIKIADFGFATKVTGEDKEHCLKTMCGTPGYVAPEILRREKYGTKADLFAMGVIVFILLGGYPPFYADDRKTLLKMTKLGKYEFDEDYWGDTSQGAKNMIRDLLLVDPDKRLSAEDCLSHPWMTEDTHKLKLMSLAKTQKELKKYIARMRFKKAIHSILFVNTFTGENAVFSGANKKKNIRALESECAALGFEMTMGSDGKVTMEV
mmetsp:Transcript_37179/g.79315  ORF Transcript_37179/g.79315 Transcript_37179/m.79315 type:complete len:685 (+) Transcript_37179:155-2209(+)